MNNETVGISAEIAIADAFDVNVDSFYRERAEKEIVSLFQPRIIDIFNSNRLVAPIKHVAEYQNPVDFVLEDKTTLSVKSNQQSLGKVAPQIIGQPTDVTYFDYFKKYINFTLPNTREERVALFKKISIEHIDTVLYHYWINLFECDHMLYFYNVLDGLGRVGKNFDCICLQKLNPPKWDKSKFYFSQTLDSWNESCTVKYMSRQGYYVSIGEFQAHNHRNCLKFRFNMQGILDLLMSKSL